jgi:ferredoxin
MKGIIFYYSGSGNTKLACEYLIKNIKSADIELVDIIKNKVGDLGGYDIVGFATFTDFGSPPRLMEKFIEKLPKQNGKPAVVFNTYGFMSLHTLPVFGALVSAKGFKIVNAYSLHTPENYPPMIKRGKGSEGAPNKMEMQAFDRWISELDRTLSKGVENMESTKLKKPLLSYIIPKFKRTKARKDMGDKFVDEKLCIRCGICEKGCPYKAVKLAPFPIFDMNKCYGCWSCFNHCPKKAIYTKKFRGKYHYPKPTKHMISTLGGRK